MRIISENHDYYDCIQRNGQDRSLIYFRKEERLNFEHSYPFPHIDNESRSRGVCCNQHVVGFCEKLYLIIELKLYFPSEQKSEFCFNIEQIDEFMTQNLSKSRLERYIKKQAKWHFSDPLGRSNFIKLFDKIAKFDAKKWFKHPVFVATHANRNHQYLIYNAQLKDVEFYRLIDPQTAFQELQMYLGNQAQPNPKMLEMSNEDNAARLGHGDKYSFRKLPTKK